MEKAKLAVLVREIGKVAPRVGKEYAEQQSAFEAEREAEEKLLASVIEMAKPGLPAISNPIKGLYEPFSESRGVLLCEDADGRPVRVYLLDEGDLLVARQDDVFDPHRRSRAEYQSVRQIIEQYDVADLVAALHAALVKQVGKREPSTATAREGAAKLNAILTLLDVPQEARVLSLPQTASVPTGKDALTGEDLPF